MLVTRARPRIIRPQPGSAVERWVADLIHKAITHSTAARNSLADQIDTLVNAGTTDAQGDLVLIESSGPTDLVEFNLQDPAFGSASTGTITLQGTPIETTADAAGTVDTFEVRDKDNNQIYTGSVTSTGGGGDLEMDNPTLTSGQTVSLESHSYSSPS